MQTAISALVMILTVIGIVTLIFVIRAMRELERTAASARALSDDTRTRLVPLLDKADVTVDALNAELLRIDMIVTRFEGASETVSNTAAAVQGITNAPERIAVGISGAIRSWRERRAAEEHEAAEKTYARSED